MTFETPSDRFRSFLRKFFLLEPITSLTIVRVIWILAFVIYSIQILASVVTFLPLIWQQGRWNRL
jgi:hypothetical protein